LIWKTAGFVGKLPDFFLGLLPIEWVKLAENEIETEALAG
jgi:hypothetical protein